MAVALLVAPQAEGCFEGAMAEFAHVLPLERQGRERGGVVEQGVWLLRTSSGVLLTVDPGYGLGAGRRRLKLSPASLVD